MSRLEELKQGETNLINSITFLETKYYDNFDYDGLDMGTWGKKVEGCGTVACALGHLAMAEIIPGLTHQWEKMGHLEALRFVYNEVPLGGVSTVEMNDEIEKILPQLFGFPSYFGSVDYQFVNRNLECSALESIEQAFFMSTLRSCISSLKHALKQIQAVIKQLEDEQIYDSLIKHLEPRLPACQGFHFS